MLYRLLAADTFLTTAIVIGDCSSRCGTPPGTGHIGPNPPSPLSGGLWAFKFSRKCLQKAVVHQAGSEPRWAEQNDGWGSRGCDFVLEKRRRL